LAAATAAALAGEMPKGFVYLADVAPGIRQDIRYAGSRNFTGAKVPGYGAAECVLARQAALALRSAQVDLSARGLGLKVFDCYRPMRAVRRFVDWASADRGTDSTYHPRVDRSALITDGYIASPSGHSTGFSVDLTLTYGSGHELDMGTPFDFFDPLAATSSKAVPAAKAKRRRVLLEAMRRAGFVNYAREWWHFSLKQRPAGARLHDFEIVARDN
jgi:D-alanyl-D-alanine dipeptidase